MSPSETPGLVVSLHTLHSRSLFEARLDLQYLVRTKSYRDRPARLHVQHVDFSLDQRHRTWLGNAVNTAVLGIGPTWLAIAPCWVGFFLTNALLVHWHLRKYPIAAKSALAFVALLPWEVFYSLVISPLVGAGTLWLFTLLTLQSRWSIASSTLSLLWYPSGRILTLLTFWSHRRQLKSLVLFGAIFSAIGGALLVSGDLARFVYRGQHNFLIAPGDWLINLLLTPVVILLPPAKRFLSNADWFAADEAHTTFWLLCEDWPPLGFLGPAAILFATWYWRKIPPAILSSSALLLLLASMSPSYTHLYLLVWPVALLVGQMAENLGRFRWGQAALVLMFGALLVQSFHFHQLFIPISEPAYSNRYHYLQLKKSDALLTGFYDLGSLQHHRIPSKIILPGSTDEITAGLYRFSKGNSFQLVVDRPIYDQFGDRERDDQRDVIENYRVMLNQRFEVKSYQPIHFRGNLQGYRYHLNWKDTP